jgi:hypothetical protein
MERDERKKEIKKERKMEIIGDVRVKPKRIAFIYYTFYNTFFRQNILMHLQFRSYFLFPLVVVFYTVN